MACVWSSEDDFVDSGLLSALHGFWGSNSDCRVWAASAVSQSPITSSLCPFSTSTPTAYPQRAHLFITSFCFVLLFSGGFYSSTSCCELTLVRNGLGTHDDFLHQPSEGKDGRCETLSRARDVDHKHLLVRSWVQIVGMCTNTFKCCFYSHDFLSLEI